MTFSTLAPLRILAVAAAVALAAALLAGAAVSASDPAGPVDGLHQTFQAGAVAPDGETVPSKAVSRRGERLTVQAVYVGRESAEPTIGVTPEGDAFYAAGAFDALPDGSPAQLARTEVLRSQDGGLTWTSVQPAVPVGYQGDDGETTLPPTTLDPYVYVDEDSGRVFNPELYVGCSYLNFSDDAGETWQTNPAACGDFVNDHQTLVSGPPPANLTATDPAFPEIVYYCFNRVADSSCGRSVDGGRTFTPTAEPAFLGYDPAAGGLCGGLHAHIQTDSEGRLFLPKGHCDFPWLAISEDGGDTWERVKIADMEVAAHEVNLAVDAADNLYALWWDDAELLPWLATSTDHGQTWTDPVMIAPPGVEQVNFPVLAAGDEGRIAVTFPGTTFEQPDEDEQDFRPWNSYVLISTNALDERPTFVSTTANDPADPIHRGECRGRCAGMFDFLDIVVSPADGDAWATAVDTCVQKECITYDGDDDAQTAFHTQCEYSCDMEGVAIRQLSGPSLRAQDDDRTRPTPRRPADRGRRGDAAP
jgi:hypothetical protein